MLRPLADVDCKPIDLKYASIAFRALLLLLEKGRFGSMRSDLQLWRSRQLQKHIDMLAISY